MIFVRPAKWLGNFLWRRGDGDVIDGSLNGVALGIIPYFTRLAGRAHDSNPHAAEPVKLSEPVKTDSHAPAPAAQVETAHAQPQYPTAHIEAVRAVKHEEPAPAQATVKTAAAHKTSPH